ncbi:hypothetical protein VCRA2116O30_130083 [Vibrio crassostreae]|uniref:Uncharacterized protein n=1 Tax=Vibrio crassostreae TaxID=246167 RepID=A0ABM9QLT9_9VIBR|nr:hypothetical protein VCRA2118O41_110072 [Vibrio crassostreae]CAK1719172.1 hypothetical protein VCRA2119O44_110083 [Vibrio crassostreae]CAK1734011.1 hypothetical protein VCRA2116O26_120072 [Vibrio crassostreae]CAK1734953.1 hypothetical protein VCRA2119O46_120084 [Vibrio crassostreae]CAK1737108.1 hypothetical protein VCRA2117O39_120083 [Vibrio crassostreae]
MCLCIDLRMLTSLYITQAKVMMSSLRVLKNENSPQYHLGNDCHNVSLLVCDGTAIIRFKRCL